MVLAHVEEGRLDLAALAKLGAETVVVDVPEGAKVEGAFANFIGGKYRDARGNQYTVTYTGGDGNDIAVTATGAGFIVLVR